MNPERRSPSVAMVLILVASLSLAGCGGDGSTEADPVEATDPGLEMCTLCSMVVAEQPVPRAQVVHRDGYRVFLCAVSELGPYLSAPSSHGKPAAVFVESLPSGDRGDPVSMDAHPWVIAMDAFYVIGGPRRPVMGESILAYERKDHAEAIASELSGKAIAWEGLESFLRTGVATN